MKNLYEAFLKSKGIQTDTRRLKKGEIFIALKGQNFDANTLVDEALQKGAVKVITSNPTFSHHPDCFFVKDTLATLQDLANYHRKQFNLPIIGITGTNGKTTTKELIAHVLSQKYKCLYTTSNLNNHIGVPLTLLQLSNIHEIAVIEMGANHPGDIAQLCEIAEPTYGIITNIGKAHLEGFLTYENIIKTKNELYQYIKNTDGTVFVNQDDELLVSISTSISKKIYYSISTFQVHIHDRFPLVFTWSFENKSYFLKSNFFGEYNLPNFLAAICVGLYFNIPPDTINKALSDYVPQNMRSQIIKTSNNTVILDAYNANPTSLHKVLTEFLNQETPLQRGLILGEMLELGEYTADEHAKILNFLAHHVKQHQNIQLVILVGNSFYQFKDAFPSFIFFPTAGEAHTYLEQNPPYQYLLLIKGSRGNKLENLIPLL
ncbi:MAG: UDP-N-acetylmuramoyl-tripeptide--D-alanyl-D-alanine ligase [Bacteroidales bacterium]|nr:UDP-N-acetylmuramoyl-tripeptide--D-alanyl-D-alanine ligase [Bacteroidales bacterium]